MIYFTIIISCYINKAILQILILSNNQCINLSVCRYESKSDWLNSINYDNNAIATIEKMHNFSYNAKCFKYAHDKNR